MIFNIIKISTLIEQHFILLSLLNLSILFFYLYPKFLICSFQLVKYIYLFLVFYHLTNILHIFAHQPMYKYHIHAFYRNSINLNNYGHLSIDICHDHAFDYQANPLNIFFHQSKYNDHDLIFCCLSNCLRRYFHLAINIGQIHAFFHFYINLNIDFHLPMIIYHYRIVNHLSNTLNI